MPITFSSLFTSMSWMCFQWVGCDFSICVVFQRVMPQVSCYLCGRDFGTRSIGICTQVWIVPSYFTSDQVFTPQTAWRSGQRSKRVWLRTSENHLLLPLQVDSTNWFKSVLKSVAYCENVEFELKPKDLWFQVNMCFSIGSCAGRPAQ